MLSILLPLIFPLLSTGAPATEQGNSAAIILIDRVASAGQNIQSSVEDGIRNINVSSIFFMLWIAGTSLLLVRTMISLQRTYRIISKGERTTNGTVRIVISDLTHPPFSFWPFAVIPRNICNSNDSADIIKHEGYHIRQMHTVDLVLSELFIAFFWFNPAAWLIKRSIVLNHEYLADNKSIRETSDIKEYQYRLVNLATGLSHIHLIHNFSSDIKNRITMINKNSTPAFATIKTVFILPAVVLIFALFSFKSSQGIQENKDKQPVFSTESQNKLLEHLFMNISYPAEAKNQNMTGKFYVIVKMKKGGIPDKVKVNDTDKDPDVPLLGNEVVVAGYGSNKPDESKDAKAIIKDRSLLTNEGVRVAKMLGSVKIPEWEKGDTEFAILFNFQLK
jgi:beta-lactamase regulating signal transducer with metallopeptidase domain